MPVSRQSTLQGARRRLQRMTLMAILVNLAVGCSTDPMEPTAKEPRCPVFDGEFQPVACAIVQGVAKSSSGSILPAYSVRVQSLDEERGFSWQSSIDSTDSDGTFELYVYQYDLAGGSGMLDNATVDILLHPSPTANPGSPILARSGVPMNFALLGDLVDATVSDVVFPFEP
jgi:hypothetical protein